VRTPGYESQRLRVDGDAQVRIVLQRITSTSRCKLLDAARVSRSRRRMIATTPPPWFLHRDREGDRRESLAVTGPFVLMGRSKTIGMCGSPFEYTEMMYEFRNSRCIRPFFRRESTGAGRRSVFGAASQLILRPKTREVAEQLDLRNGSDFRSNSSERGALKAVFGDSNDDRHEFIERNYTDRVIPGVAPMTFCPRPHHFSAPFT